MVTVEWSGDQPMTNGLHIRCMVIDTIDTTETVQWELTATFSIQPTTLTKDTLLVISYSNRAPYSEQEQHYHTHRLHKLFSHKTTHSIYTTACQTTKMCAETHYSSSEMCYWVWTRSMCYVSLTSNQLMYIACSLTYTFSDFTHSSRTQASKYMYKDSFVRRWVGLGE